LQPNNGSGDSSSSAVVVGEEPPVALPEPGGGVAVKVEELSSAREDFEALEAKIEAEYQAIRSRDANAHVVPIPSGWFSWTKVHSLEEKTLPSFFNGKIENRTPEIYMEIRNWIMTKFHTNPNTQVESKDLSELSIGELDAKQEVMEFLDYWGLINYHPFPPVTDSTLPASDADGEKSSISLVEKLYRFETEEPRAPAVSRINVATPSVPSKLFTDSTIVDELAGPEGPPEYHCNSCSADCSRKRYHCQKQADFDLCSECFNSGKFGSYMSPSDFILMEPAEAAGATSSKWTDQETLLLLEALELYKENWTEIAEHVATKTKTQCILHFVQMPIEDNFLDCDDDAADPISTADDEVAEAVETAESKDGESNINQPLPLVQVEASKKDVISEVNVCKENDENRAVKALREAFEAVGSLNSAEDNTLSFAEAGNPVMALAAFLVRLAEPTAITAAVQSSIKSISGSDSNIQLAARHCFFLEDPPGDQKSAKRDTDMAEQEEPKDDKTKSDLDNIGKNKDSVIETEENKPVSSDTEAEKKSGVADNHEDAPAAAPKKESENLELVKEHAESTAEKSNATKDSTDGGSAGHTESTETPKDDVKDSEQPVDEIAEKAVDEEKESSESKNKIDIEKVKGAAITAISAAAVKAKLLATQEEDQIRQLATSLVEKQLHKLETKLSFFNEMENVVMRAREHLERSKQKLFQERSQIIAARLGVSAAARPMMQQQQQPTLPVNRAAMAFANSAHRPPAGMMMSQRPPVARPAMAPVAPPASMIAPPNSGAPSSAI
jgi:SWI/SNF related-matrix-associated actin-dependent regulator of chromatin subfamily C